MLIEVWWIGETSDVQLAKSIEIYKKRISRLSQMRWICLKEPKYSASESAELRMEKEAASVLAKLQSDDFLVILDERGQEYTSKEWASWLESKMAAPGKRIILLIGGPFGFSERIADRANASMALSKMTFTHEMVRLILSEQLYRAFTILKNIKYHY